MNADQRKIRKLSKELELLRSLARPFTECKVHNPNNSNKLHTSRVMSLKARDIFNLKGYFEIRDSQEWN